MQVDISRVRDAKGASITVRGTVDLTEALGQEPRAVAPAEVEATVTNTGRFLHVEGKITARLLAECVRCLSPCELFLNVPFDRDFMPGNQPPVEDADGEFVPFVGDVMHLDEAVREAVIVALPMKTLCRVDCPGLCARCGRNLSEGRCACPPESEHSGLSELARLFPKKEV